MKSILLLIFVLFLLFIEHALLVKVLSDLHRIEGCAFLDLVAHHPECQAIVATIVFTNTAHIHLYLIQISEPTRLLSNSYAVSGLKKKKKGTDRYTFPQ